MVSDRQAESLDADTDADGDGDGSSSMDDAVQLRSAYVLHVLNHVLKARSKQVKHNARVRKAELAAAGQSCLRLAVRVLYELHHITLPAGTWYLRPCQHSCADA